MYLRQSTAEVNSGKYIIAFVSHVAKFPREALGEEHHSSQELSTNNLHFSKGNQGSKRVGARFFCMHDS